MKRQRVPKDKRKPKKRKNKKKKCRNAKIEYLEEEKEKTK
jgi:hypothetical protein